MKNNINTNKLVYQKPEIALFDLSDLIKSDPTSGNDGFVSDIFS